MRRSYWLIVTAFMLSGQVALSQQPDVHSGNFIMPGCRDFVTNGNGDPSFQGVCLGSVSTLMSLGPKLGFCFPPGATPNQGVRVVVQYLDLPPRRPQTRNGDDSRRDDPIVSCTPLF
jgi:hypothetical protein